MSNKSRTLSPYNLQSNDPSLPVFNFIFNVAQKSAMWRHKNERNERRRGKESPLKKRFIHIPSFLWRHKEVFFRRFVQLPFVKFEPLIYDLSLDREVHFLTLHLLISFHQRPNSVCAYVCVCVNVCVCVYVCMSVCVWVCMVKTQFLVLRKNKHVQRKKKKT